MLLQELYDKVKPKTQDLDAFVYFDQEGLIYEPSAHTRLFVRDGAVRTPGITRVGDLTSQLQVISIPKDSIYEFYNFDDIPKEFSDGELQESFVQSLNAVASYGDTLFIKAVLKCVNNEIQFYCSGLQYVLSHKSKCLMPNFEFSIYGNSWNILYFLHQLIKENRVKKTTYYTIGVHKNDYLWINHEDIYFRIGNINNTHLEDNSFTFFESRIDKDNVKKIGTFDRKYINEVEKNVKLKHLLKAFTGNVDMYKCDRIKIFKDSSTILYFL